MLRAAWLLPATSPRADVRCCGLCFLPVLTSVSGDGASGVGGAPSLGAHNTDFFPQEKVMLGKVRGTPSLSWSLAELANPAEPLRVRPRVPAGCRHCPQRGLCQWMGTAGGTGATGHGGVWASRPVWLMAVSRYPPEQAARRLRSQRVTDGTRDLPAGRKAAAAGEGDGSPFWFGNRSEAERRGDKRPAG